MPNELFENAELSQAAYATFNSSLTFEQEEFLRDESVNFTEAQFTFFAQRYPEIVTQLTDTATCLSAAVFKDTHNKLTVAFRGSASPFDSLDD